MDDEYVIGFDCREMWLTGFKNWDPSLRAQSLNPKTEKELRVGRGEWHSFFINSSAQVNGEWVNTVPGYSFRIPDVFWTAYGFWNELDAMRSFVVEHKQELQEPFWMIAITLVETESVEAYLERGSDFRRSFMPNRDEVRPSDVNPEWTFLGYDVQNDGPEFGKGLGDGYPEIIQTELREKWGSYLNRYYLFDDFEPAHLFALWKDINEAGAGPFFVYGLYRIES